MRRSPIARFTQNVRFDSGCPNKDGSPIARVDTKIRFDYVFAFCVHLSLSDSNLLSDSNRGVHFTSWSPHKAWAGRWRGGVDHILHDYRAARFKLESDSNAARFTKSPIVRFKSRARLSDSVPPDSDRFTIKLLECVWDIF